MAKKKSINRTRKASAPKRIHMSSKKWAIGSVIVLAIAIPVTMSLVSQSQDIRQQASETRINSTVITTMPTDILVIDVSNEDGNAQQDNSNGKGNNQNGKQSSGGNQQNGGDGGNNQLEGSEDCETQDTTERSGGGTMRTIIINCDGKNQSDDQSGSDGNNQTIDSGGKDGQISAPGRGNKVMKEGKGSGKNAKQQGKEKGRSGNRNWIQQFIDRILGRQGR